MASRKELQERVRELEEENEDLNDRLDQITDLATPEEDEEGDEGEELRPPAARTGGSQRMLSATAPIATAPSNASPQALGAVSFAAPLVFSL